MTAAETPPYSAGSRGGQPPSARSAPHAARVTIFGLFAIASATGVDAIEMNASLTALRAEFKSRSASPPAVPLTLTKCSSPSGSNAARTCASSAPST